MKTKSLWVALVVICTFRSQSAGTATHSHDQSGVGPRTGTICLLPGRDAIPTGHGIEEPREYTEAARDEAQLSLYLRKATGKLAVYGNAGRDTYQVYFHVPIPFSEQAPVSLEITCPSMIDYRFIREDPPNLIVAARMLYVGYDEINWTAWVLVRQNSYRDLPTYVPIPPPEQLPDSVRPWLATTDCCQLSASDVQRKADSLRDTTTNLMKLADDVCHFCRSIPFGFGHEPVSFDAEYALKWGHSCTGHAHAAAALLRANGIPARTLLNMPDWASNYDMHWIIDYYVPGYGWVRMESSTGENPAQPQDELVVRACNPGDEFPVWYPRGIDAGWHTSDTTFPMPNWAGAHNAFAVLSLVDSAERIDYAIALTKWVFGCHSAYSGIRLTPDAYAAFASGLSHQTDALARIQAGDLPGYIAEMQEALIDYQNVNPAPIETLFSEDFENDVVGWTHGGSQDEWELGKPTYGPAGAYSGLNCWGTNLDGPYANNDDCWLQTPLLDLSRLASASLSFWIWNSVQDNDYSVEDPVWVEISRDGTTFHTLSCRMAGVNDDPEITPVGGWSHVFLDLFQYLGDTVRLRFRFRSDSSGVFAGSYIDDVQITGRRASAGIAEAPNREPPTASRLPTVVGGVLRLPLGADIKPQVTSCLLDACGRKLLDLGPGVNDVRALAPGVYFVREEPRAAGRIPHAVQKIVVTR